MRPACAFVALGEPEYPAALRQIEFGAADSRAARPRGGASAAGGGDRRFAQRIGSRIDLRRPPGARSRRGGLRDRFGSGARHRPARARRVAGDRHDRRAGRRPRQALSAGSRAADRADRGVRRGRLGNADRLGAARARLPAPQPHRLGAGAGRRDRRGRAQLRLADHREVRRRTEPGGLRGSWLTARSARRGNERSAARRRNALRPARRRVERSGAAARARALRNLREGPRDIAGGLSAEQALLDFDGEVSSGAESVRFGERRRAAARACAPASSTCSARRRFPSTNWRAPPKRRSARCGSCCWSSTWPADWNIRAERASASSRRKMKLDVACCRRSRGRSLRFQRWPC